MANWNGFKLTKKGKVLNAKVNAGIATLHFNRVGLGSGSVSSTNQQTLGNVEQFFTFNINPPDVNGPVMTLEFTAHNKDLEQEYAITEMGLYAEDPDEGEILFAYMLDNAPDVMPARGTATVVQRRIKLHLIVTNTGNVSVDTVGAFVTVEDIERHNNDAEAHGALMRVHNESLDVHANKFAEYIRKDGDTATGKIYVPTPETSDNSRVIANTAFVNNLVDEVVKRILGDAPSNIRTMEALATALANDPTFADTMRAELAKRAPLNSPTFSGSVRVPTAGGGENSTIAASTQWVRSMIDNSGFIPRGSTRSSYNETGYRVFSDGFTIQWIRIAIDNRVKYYDVALPISCDVVGVIPLDTIVAKVTEATVYPLTWNVEGGSNSKVRVLFNGPDVGTIHVYVFGKV